MEIDKKIIKGLGRLYNNFLNWFDKFSKWAVSDIWLINEVSFKEEKGKSKFFWDSPNYEFEFEIRDYEEKEVILKVDIYRPSNISFKKQISREEAYKLIERAKEINKFYSDNEKELIRIKRNVILKILDYENDSIS